MVSQLTARVAAAVRINKANQDLIQLRKDLRHLILANGMSLEDYRECMTYITTYNYSIEEAVEYRKRAIDKKDKEFLAWKARNVSAEVVEKPRLSRQEEVAAYLKKKRESPQLNEVQIIQTTTVVDQNGNEIPQTLHRSTSTMKIGQTPGKKYTICFT